MAATGGITPFDKANALVGPTRVLWALPAVAIPTDMTSVVALVANAQGEYPAVTGWNDFGLSAEAPTYIHDKDTEGLDYQQPRGALFEVVSEITRQFVAQVAEISPENMAIVENSSQAITTIAAAAGKSAQKKLPFGSYESLLEKRIVMLCQRPPGAAAVIEPAPSSRTRSPLVALVLPRVVLAAEESELEFDAEDPVNAEVTFSVLPDSTLTAGAEYGFWLFEQAGTIA